MPESVVPRAAIGGFLRRWEASGAAERAWPKTLPEQAQAVRAALAENPAGLTAPATARLFLRARTQTVAELLKTLVSLGQARTLNHLAQFGEGEPPGEPVRNRTR